MKEDKTVENKVIVDSSAAEFNLFELSNEEEKVYTDFQKDLNLEHLRRLEPISIGKLYVQTILDKKIDAQYALYTDRKEYIQWSKEEDEKIPVTDRGTSEQVIKQFKNIDKGEFIQTNDYEGYIEYDSGKGKSGFKMIKNEDGIWQVAFLPIQ
ncbi:hypothetical protein AC622_00040 [Bacillus sp. FJAT-27916]|nr:hypothetical protein AC622_00040 [Bacillus sp. FJAT-27916]